MTYYDQIKEGLAELHESYADMYYDLIEMGIDPSPLQEAYELRRLVIARSLVKYYKGCANKMISSLKCRTPIEDGLEL